MTTSELSKRIEIETGLKTSVRKGSGSVRGYFIFTLRNNKKFEYEYSRKLIKEFPQCDVNPPFANNYQIMIYHGIYES